MTGNETKIEALSYEVLNEETEIVRLYNGDERIRDILCTHWYLTYSNSHMKYLFGKLRAIHGKSDEEERINYLKERSLKIYSTRERVMERERSIAISVNKSMKELARDKISILNLPPYSYEEYEDRLLLQLISSSKRQLEELLSDEEWEELQ